MNALQNLFPGLYLVGLTVDAYRAHDSLVCYGFFLNFFASQNLIMISFLIFCLHVSICSVLCRGSSVRPSDDDSELLILWKGVLILGFLSLLWICS